MPNQFTKKKPVDGSIVSTVSKQTINKLVVKDGGECVDNVEKPNNVARVVPITRQISYKMTQYFIN